MLLEFVSDSWSRGLRGFLYKAVALLVSAFFSQMIETGNCGDHSNRKLFTRSEKGSAYKSEQRVMTTT